MWISCVCSVIMFFKAFCFSVNDLQLKLLSVIVLFTLGLFLLEYSIVVAGCSGRTVVVHKSVKSSWRGLLLWYHHVATLKLWSRETTGISPFSISLFFLNFLPLHLTGWYVFLSFHCLLMACVRAESHCTLLFFPLPFSAAHSCIVRDQTIALCTQTWQSVTDTEASANYGNDACDKMKKHRGVGLLPRLCSLLLPHT